jgi:hypothetical protein
MELKFCTSVSGLQKMTQIKNQAVKPPNEETNPGPLKHEDGMLTIIWAASTYKRS